jgi:hypothetical protein
MLQLRLLFAAIFLASLPFGLCSSSGDNKGGLSDQVKAVKVALVVRGGDPNNLPPIGEAYDCTISVAVTPTPPATRPTVVPGRCQWTVEQQGNVWLATFREAWSCADWSVEKAGYPPCQPPTDFHEWQYQVDLRGPVQEIAESGAFAPDMR